MSSTAQAPRRFRSGKLLKAVRRIHMYAGLMLLPWLLLFGISGVLFNHPNIGEDVTGQRVGEADLRALTRQRPWAPRVIAQRVVDRLNAPASADALPGAYELDPTFQSELTGFTVLSAPATDGQYMLLLDVEKSAGVLVTRKVARTDPRLSFPARIVSLPEFSTQAVEQNVSGLLAARHLPARSELRRHPKIAPELRFRVRDAQQTSWNVTYDLGSGAVSGRRSDVTPALPLTQLLGRLHMTHHFPLKVGALWFWALFADLLGMTMVLWSITGLVMWWQMKPTRVIGAVALTTALGIAALVMGGTAQHLTFGGTLPALGPGE